MLLFLIKLRFLSPKKQNYPLHKANSTFRLIDSLDETYRRDRPNNGSNEYQVYNPDVNPTTKSTRPRISAFGTAPK